MKRNLYGMLMVLFILSACQPSPDGQGQATMAIRSPSITATVAPTSTHTPEPTPTPEVSYLINADLPLIDKYEFVDNYDRIAKEFDDITLEDITSGRLLEFEKAYLAENPIFTDEVIPSVFGKNYVESNGGWKILKIVPSISREIPEQIMKPETRPLKIFSYYRFYDDKTFKDMGMDIMKNQSVSDWKKGWPVWMAAWAYKNPSGNVTIGHSLLPIHGLIEARYMLKDSGVDFKPCPHYKFENVKETDEEAKNSNYLWGYVFWKNHPDLKPDEALIDKWVETGEMDEELQKDLFYLNTYPLYW